MALPTDPIKYTELIEGRRQRMKKRWEDPEFREKALKRLSEIKGVKRGTRYQQKVRKRRELKLIEKENKKIENYKEIRHCLRCGKEMRPYLISKEPIKYVYLFRCKCYPKGYYTD